MKILCIDGGGIRGAFAIASLQAMEETYGITIHDHFDLIAGTSTGAIIAASAALKTSMDTLLNQYLHYGDKIFMKEAKFGLFKSIYSDRNLRKLLRESFGDCELSEVKKPLLIPAVDLTRGKPYVHRSYEQSDHPHLSIKLWDAVLSSCSAPVYFPPNNIGNEFLSVDGGLWANNPSLACLTDALHHFNQQLDSIHILSLGTGKQRIDFSIKEDRDWGIKHWLPFQFTSMKVTPKLLDLALDISSESVTYHCEQLLRDHYVRVNKDLGEEMPFDDIAYMDKLVELGRESFFEHQGEIEAFFAGAR